MQNGLRAKLAVALVATLLSAVFGTGIILEAHADRIFWSSTSSPTNIGTSNTDGTSVQNSFIVSPTNVYGIARHGSYLYLAADTSIARASVDGTSINNTFIPALTMVSAIAVTDQYIFWSDGQYIGRADLSGSNIVYQFYSAGQTISALAANATHVYFAGFSLPISRIGVDGSGAVQLPANQNIFGTGMAVDDQYLYYTGVSGIFIGRMKLDGTGNNDMFIDQFASGYSAASGIALDSTSIYWVAEHGFTATYSIARANLDGTPLNNTLVAGIGQPRSIIAPVQAHTITFETAVQVGIQYGPLSLSATASSGLAVTFTSTTPSICTVSGNKVTFVTTGTCSITASQAGNGRYSSAPNVTREFLINPLPGALASKCSANGSCEGADLRGADLKNIDLSGINFNNADLLNADLSGAKLDGANLAAADLRGAVLYKASLKNVYAPDADLRSVVASYADFTGAYLRRVDMRGGFLFNAILTSANLNEVDFRGASLFGTNLVGASLLGADLRGANLTKAVRAQAATKPPNFSSADLTRAKLAKAKIPGANFSKANLTRADLRNGDFTKANFKGAILKGTKLKGAITKGAKGLPKGS